VEIGMLALLFEVSGQRYGLDAAQVLRVVPYVRLRWLSGAPSYVAGTFPYRDTLVPVIDLSQLIGGKPAAHLLSTRIVLTSHPGPHGEGRILGLLAERATDCIEDETVEVKSAGFVVPEAPFLGGLSVSGNKTIQYVKVESLLPDE